MKNINCISKVQLSKWLLNFFLIFSLFTFAGYAGESYPSNKPWNTETVLVSQRNKSRKLNYTQLLTILHQIDFLQKQISDLLKGFLQEFFDKIDVAIHSIRNKIKFLIILYKPIKITTAPSYSIEAPSPFLLA
jgi:hypothetical protein